MEQLFSRRFCLFGKLQYNLSSINSTFYQNLQEYLLNSFLPNFIYIVVRISQYYYSFEKDTSQPEQRNDGDTLKQTLSNLIAIHMEVNSPSFMGVKVLNKFFTHIQWHYYNKLEFIQL
ncbi:unnamed protein product [Paramecium pentaurelia]|uniref:Uncharacterized protein n=1 Tax=Paramecium pentaurelia TaxID=43138 RepID=A0A8S1Y6Y5_9CILI|nr:unnamed protein product [Paramecium pentaurelia]